MDSHHLYTEPVHPVDRKRSVDFQRAVRPRFRRCQVDIRYYLTGLKYATWFRDHHAQKFIKDRPLPNRAPAPEQKPGRLYDPFAVDVYQLGYMLRVELIPSIPQLEFLLPLAGLMTERDPAKRPSLKYAIQFIKSEFTRMWNFQKQWPLIPPGQPVAQLFDYFIPIGHHPST
ncbi:hypothetical protein RhiTH_008982 [Rhizoctonia solani]